MQKSVTKRGQSVKTEVPRVAPRLQNEILEPPKFIKNSDLDLPKGQEVAPQVSEAPPEAKFRQNSTKNDQKSLKI